MQAVQLDDARIDLDGDMLDAGARGARYQPGRHGRSNDDPRVRPPVDERVDDFDRAGRVPEAVTGNVENDRSTGVQRAFYGGSTYVLRTLTAPALGGASKTGGQLRAVDRGGRGLFGFGHLGVLVFRQALELIGEQQ
jgi:hypothetical protein